MKSKNVDYAWFAPFSEILGIPVFTVKAIKRLVKKEKFADSLNKIIEQAKEEAKLPPKKGLTPVRIQLLKDKYFEANDFFSIHFNSKELQGFSFDEKIEYCTEKYKEESKTILTATNSLILEEDFLKGAKSTLTMYFFFQNHKISIEEKKEKPESKPGINTDNKFEEIKDFRSLFLKECDYEAVYNFFDANGLLPEKGKFRRGSKRTFAYMLLGLQEKGIIRQLEANQLSAVIANSFMDGISTSTISNVKIEGSNNMDSSSLYLLNSLYKELRVKC